MSESLLSSILQGTRPAVTYAHPIVSLRQGHTHAVELLTRFQAPGGAMCTVGRLLEDTGLPAEDRIRLDLLCLEGVFSALARHPITDSLLFVNLHPLTLTNSVFWERIRPWLWDLSIPPHRLVVEITEAYALHDLDELERLARKLRAMELRIAVDDLGAGSASLSNMARLAPDFIKADISLVHKVHRRPYQAALLNALALFAERMRVGFIAEGIETAEELQAVVDADVPFGQGFIFGEPGPLAASGAPTSASAS